MERPPLISKAERAVVPAPAPPRGPWRVSKTDRALLCTVLLAAVAQWAPGLEVGRWLPDDLTTLLPRVFRGEVDAPFDPGADVADDALLAESGRPGKRTRRGVTTAEPDADELLPHVGQPELEAGLEEDESDGALDDEDNVDFVFESDAELPPSPEPQTLDSGLTLLPIEDRQGSLRRFREALTRVSRGDPDALVRVLHYGDSLIAGDYVTQTVRRLLQKRFGDGGHGFVLAGRPARWYRRDNLRLHSSEGWEILRLTRPTVNDGAYGLGGVTFRTSAAGQWVRTEPAGEEIGASVSRMQVFYLAQPRGGRFELRVGPHRVEVDTRSDDAGSRQAEIQIPEGSHRLEIRTLGRGEVRLFGVVHEREGPGVIYDSLGLDGARARLLKRMDPPHWHAQLRMRQPDLLILHYGTNESQADQLNPRRYRADLAQTVGHLRQALPGVSCLLVGPLDRAMRGPQGALVTRPVVERIVDVQRRVAYDQGCAFWNTFEAMGGSGSMGRWYRARPALAGGDLTHPTRLGAERVGKMLFAALIDTWQNPERP